MPKQSYSSIKIPAWKAVALLLFRPRLFVRTAVRHDRALRKPLRRPQRATAARTLRTVLGTSAFTVVISAIVGALMGILLAYIAGQPLGIHIAILQSISGAILLWATLSVLGSELQTYIGSTLAERVNRWIFRFNYCLGTCLLVTSLVWPLPIPCLPL